MLTHPSSPEGAVEDKGPLCQLSSTLFEEKWHTWFSTPLFLYETSAPGETLTRMPQSYFSSKRVEAGAYFKKGNVLAPSTLYWDRLTVTG